MHLLRGLSCAAFAALALASTANPANAAGEAEAAATAVAADTAVSFSGTASVLNRGRIEYTLTLANNGPELVVTPITATLQFPTEVTIPPRFSFWSGSSCSFGVGGAITCSAPGGAFMSCTFPGTGGPRSVTCSAREASGIGSATPFQDRQVFISVDAASAGTASVTAALDPSDAITDPNAANDSSTVSTTIQPMADLSVAATAPGNRIVGDVYAYTVEYANNGPNDATDAQLSVALPANVSVGGGLPAGCSGAGPYTCALGALASGATGSKVFTVTADATGNAQAAATISSTTGDSFSGNDSASAVTTITVTALPPGSDLAITVSPPVSAKAGEFQQFSYTLVNNGPDVAASVTLTGTLPAGAQRVSLSGAGCTFTSTGFSCTYASLANLETRTVSFGMYLDAPGTATTTAAATTSSSDPVSANDTASASVDVLPQNADPAIFLSGPTRALEGTQVQYVLTFGNNGPDAIYTPMSATFQLPAELSTPPVFGFDGGSSCSFGSGGAVTCSSPSRPTMRCAFPGSGGPRSVTCSASDRSGIGPGSAHWPSGRVFIASHVASVGAGSTTLVATLDSTAAASNPDAANDTAALTTRLFTGSFPIETDLQVTQSAPASVRPNDTYVYSVTVRNVGPDTADPVTVTDNLPPEVAFVSATGGTCTGAPALSCDLGSIGRFAQKTLAITVRATTEGSAVNTASASAPGTDVVPGDNSATSTTAIRNPIADLELTMTGPASVVVNRGFEYAITVHNAGPDTANNVRVRGTLPVAVRLDFGNSACFASGLAYECVFNSMSPNQTKTATLRLKGDETTTFTSAASVTQTEVDPDASDNSASVTTTITPPPTADLAVTIDPAPRIRLGDSLAYTVTITNNGPDPATGLTLNSYFLTAGFESETATPDAGACSVRRNGASIDAGPATTVVCGLAGLAVGASWHVAVQATAVLGGTYQIGALAVSNLSDPDQSNDVVSSSTVVFVPPTIACAPDVTATTDAGAATATVAPGTASAGAGTPPLSVVGTRSDGQALSAGYPIGTTTITWTVTDAVSETATCTQTVTVADEEAPATTAAATPAPVGGWSTTPVSVALAATDNSGAVGSIHYSAAGANPIESTSVGGATATVPIAADGVTTLTYWAEDAAGNAEAPQTLVIRIDATRPTVVCDDPDGLWHGDNVSRECHASDEISGLSGPAVLSLETAVVAGVETDDAPTASAEVCDLADNCVTAGPLGGNRVDRAAPAIAVLSPADGAAFLVGTDVAADYSCADGGSGLAGCVGTVADGAPLDTSSVGRRDLAIVATDAVGNTATRLLVYDVVQRLCVLSDQTEIHDPGTTVPVRLRPCDPTGDLSIRAVSLDGGALLPSASNPGELFRRTGGAYHYNLRLPASLEPGLHLLRVALGGEAFLHTVEIRTR